MAEQLTAFKSCVILDRRQSGAGSLRSVGVDDSGSKVYLGLEDGVLEEHTLAPNAANVVSASLSARKHLCKKAILGIAHLGVTANALAALTEDGTVHLLDCESLDAHQLPLRQVAALTVAHHPSQPTWLAVAMKPSKRVVRIEVYGVPRSGEGWGRRPPLATAQLPDSSPSVKGMAWVGEQLLLCTGLRYLMVVPGAGEGKWRELFALPQDLAYSPAMVQPLPQLGQALLTVGPAGILVDASGGPCGSALRLEGGATPRALGASGVHLLAACEDAIHVFDCGGGAAGGAEVQLLEYGHGMRPAPGQPMYAGCNPSGSLVVVAGRAVVWACLPVSLEEQARELLLRREYGQAWERVQQGLGRGERWAEVGSAQAALCMLQDCAFEAAGEALQCCSPSVFQPSQLFPLFPEYSQQWVTEVPPTPLPYWGLCPPLQAPLGDIITQHLASRHPSPPPSPFSSSNGQPTPAAPAHLDPQQQQQQEPPHRKAAHAQSEGDRGAGEARRLRQLALHTLVHYLFRVRMLGGVQCPQGVDTLLLHLLVEGGAKREVAAFVAVPNQADAEAVGGRLQALGWLHALATLRSCRGDAQGALLIWRQLVEGKLSGQEDGGESAELQAAERREALESTQALLANPLTSPPSAVLSSLPWLIPASPPTALAVLTARPLDPHAVLAVLPPDSAVRLHYLDHLVACMMSHATAADESSLGQGLRGEGGRGPPSSAPPGVQPQPAAAGDSRQLGEVLKGLSPEDRSQIHTELATQLVAALFREDPGLRDPGNPPHPPPLPRTLPPLLTPRSSTVGGGGGSRGESRAGSRRASAAAHAGHLSTAALVSRALRQQEKEGSSCVVGSKTALAAGGGVTGLRLRLRDHLESSGQYDRGVVLGALGGSGLHEELVVLHCQMGDHLAALRVLCLALRDIAGAQAYATAFLPPQEYRTLLHVVLHPGGGREPLYEDATYLVTALGEYLDPMDVLQTLPPSMPLVAAAGIVAPIMRDRTHRRRQGAVAKSLLRAQLMRARGEKCDAESVRVVVDDERACPGCHLRIGGKVFVALNHPAAKHSQNGAGQVAAADAWGGWPGAGAHVSSRAAGGGALDGADRSQHAHHGSNGGERDIQVFCYSCYRRMAGKGAGLRETVGEQS